MSEAALAAERAWRAQAAQLEEDSAAERGRPPASGAGAEHGLHGHQHQHAPPASQPGSHQQYGKEAALAHIREMQAAHLQELRRTAGAALAEAEVGGAPAAPLAPAPVGAAAAVPYGEAPYQPDPYPQAEGAAAPHQAASHGAETAAAPATPHSYDLEHWQHATGYSSAEDQQQQWQEQGRGAAEAAAEEAAGTVWERGAPYIYGEEAAQELAEPAPIPTGMTLSALGQRAAAANKSAAAAAQAARQAADASALAAEAAQRAAQQAQQALSSAARWARVRAVHVCGAAGLLVPRTCRQCWRLFQ